MRKIKKESPVKLLTPTEVKYIHEVMLDAGEVLRCFYARGDWLERKGTKLMMEEMQRAEDSCLIALRSLTKEE